MGAISTRVTTLATVLTARLFQLLWCAVEPNLLLSQADLQLLNESHYGVNGTVQPEGLTDSELKTPAAHRL